MLRDAAVPVPQYLPHARETPGGSNDGVGPPGSEATFR